MIDFPIKEKDKTGSIPWELIAQHEKQVLTNHGQSLLNIAAVRGGLTYDEVYAALNDMKLSEMRGESSIKERFLNHEDFVLYKIAQYKADKEIELQQERSNKMVDERKFPILGTQEFIPWGLIAKHESQALTNHGQSLCRLAERGGLSYKEAFAVLNDKRYHEVEGIEDSLAKKMILDLVRQYKEQYGKVSAKIRGLSVEQIELRKILTQLLADDGINRETIKDLVKEVIGEKVEKAIKQVINESGLSIKGMVDRELKNSISKQIESQVATKVRDTLRSTSITIMSKSYEGDNEEE